MSKINTYIGTYTDKGSKGIYKVVLDTLHGTLEGPWLFYEIKSPKYIDCHHGYLASIIEKGDHAGVALVDINQPVPYHMDTKMSEDITSCFVCQDDTHVYTANYHEGTMLVYRKEHGKLSIEQRIQLGEKAKCHQVLLLNNLVYLVSLGLDRINIYDPENHYSFVDSILFPKGTGPRHAIADAKHQYLYVLSELSNEVFVYSISAHQALRCQQINSVIPQGIQEECASAAIRISPNGKYLYTSTRGADIITCFEIIDGYLRQKYFFQCGGKHPRDFIIDESGRWMLVANRFSNQIVLFKLDPDTGEIIELSDEKEIPDPVSIAFQ